MHTNLIILAGGASSRMKKSTNYQGLSQEEIEQANKRSKGLIGVGDGGKRPLMDYLLYNAKQAGYKNIYLVIGEERQLFNEFYGEKIKGNDFYGLSISYAIQYLSGNRTKPYGTADALYQAIEQYPELKKQYYSVCNSDNLYSVQALSALRSTQAENAFISYSRDALEFPEERISGFALVKLGIKGELLDIVEKPNKEEIDNCKDAEGRLRVSMNIFKFNGTMFNEFIENCPVNKLRDEKELPTALLNMIKEYPESTYGIPFSEHVPDLTAKEDIVTIKEYLSKYYNELSW